MGKCCSFGILCVCFVNVYHFVRVLLFCLILRVGMWDLIEVPDQCLSFHITYIHFIIWPQLGSHGEFYKGKIP